MHYGKLQSVPNCFLRSDSNLGNKRRRREKIVVAEKVKSAPMFQQGDSKVRHQEPTTICYTLPPPSKEKTRNSKERNRGSQKERKTCSVKLTLKEEKLECE